MYAVAGRAPARPSLLLLTTTTTVGPRSVSTFLLEVYLGCSWLFLVYYPHLVYPVGGVRPPYASHGEIPSIFRPRGGLPYHFYLVLLIFVLFMYS